MDCRLLYQLFRIECPENREFNIAEAARNYRKIALKLHPDKQKSEECRNTLNVLNNFWNLMKVDELRQAYEENGRMGLELEAELDLPWYEVDKAITLINQLIREDNNNKENEGPRTKQTPKKGENINKESQNNSSSEKAESFREEIDEILDHSFRRKQLKFKVKWARYNLGDYLWEKEDIIYKEFPNSLAEYLNKLKSKRNRSFISLIRTNPHFGKLLKK